MKTLIVSYLPRGKRSHTKKLLDAFLDSAAEQELEHLDLLEEEVGQAYSSSPPRIFSVVQ